MGEDKKKQAVWEAMFREEVKRLMAEGDVPEGVAEISLREVAGLVLYLNERQTNLTVQGWSQRASDRILSFVLVAFARGVTLSPEAEKAVNALAAAVERLTKEGPRG